MELQGRTFEEDVTCMLIKMNLSFKRYINLNDENSKSKLHILFRENSQTESISHTYKKNPLYLFKVA
jgi:hypothetical protein